MATIKEDYVSFETAKLLKEKGFPQEYNNYHALVYNEEDYEDEYEVQRMVLETKLVKAGTLSSYPIGVPEPKCYCPSQSMAMKWLREIHHLYINVGFGNDYKGEFLYMGDIYDLTKDAIYAKYEPIIEADDYLSDNPKTYEEAVEVAIKYCLENLI